MATVNIYEMAQTWNAGGTTFTAIKMDVTDTASAAASLLMDLLVAASSKFKVDKTGLVTATTGYVAGVKASLDINQPGLSMASDGSVVWSGTSNYFNTKDAGIRRSAANVIQFNNGTAGAGGALETFEMTAPAAPTANGVRIYAVDNGSGKTQLLALFSSGAAQQLAIEP